MKRKAKTSPKDQPFMPLFFGDFLASTAEWDGEERSLYLLCLAHQWELGSLPAEPRKLRKLVDYEPDSFERWWPTVSAKFIETRSGRIGNARLEEHRAKSIEISQSKASAGKAGAAARWGKDGKGIDSEKHMPSKLDGTATDSHGKGNGTAKASENGAAIDLACVRHDFGNGSIPSHPIPSESAPESSSDSDSSQGPQGRPVGDSHEHPTEPDPEQIGAAEEETPARDEPPAFTAIRNLYPRRVGSQRWADALGHYRANLRAGHSAEVQRAGVERYVAFCTAEGITGTRTVQQAATFLGRNRGFLEPWTLSPPVRPRGPDPAQLEREAIELLRARRASVAGLKDFREPRAGETSKQYRAAQDEAWNAHQDAMRPQPKGGEGTFAQLGTILGRRSES